jgi:hypothetical protein
VLLAGAIGVLLRLALPDQVQYLGDEAWTFRHVQDVRNGGAWESIGMPSSRGVRNPGMSVWAFVIVGMLGQVTSPAGLTRGVAVAAILGHALMLAIPLHVLPRDSRDRKVWIWAFILCATNPILVFLERKIWAQSLLPIIQVGMLIAWMRRETRVGAFFWGLLGAIAGQIHMAGFFFVPSLALFSWAGERISMAQKARWRAWGVGTVLGAVPAVPWALYLIHERPAAAPSSWWLRFRLEFYQYFFSDPSGLSSEYFMGADFIPLMRYPLIAGHATWLVLIAHVALGIATFAIAVSALVHAWSTRANWKAWLHGGPSDTGILVSATLVGMGALMTLPSMSIHRHYMLALFPVPYLWTARAALQSVRGERWLRWLFVGGFVVCAGMLSFLSVNGGGPGFGKSLATQLRDGTPPEAAANWKRP